MSIAAAQPVNTREASRRRELHFNGIGDLRAEFERLVAAEQAGRLEVAGNWSAGQNFQHLAKVIEASYDGFTFSAPLPLRILGKAFKPMALSMTIRAGVRLKGPSTVLLPDESVTAEAGTARLRAALGRIERGERMTQVSPLLGRMSHGDWIRLHLRHAELHLGFLHPKWAG